MTGALGFGLLAGSSFVIGAIIAVSGRVPQKLLGSIMALGAGALISAVSFKLVDEAGRLAGGSGWFGAGLLVGGGAFIGLMKLAESVDSRPHHELRIVDVVDLSLAIVPEAVVIVAALLASHGVEAAVITAVFLCGVPESIWWAERLQTRNVPRRAVIGVPIAMMLLCGLTAAVVYPWLDGATPHTVGFVLAAAGGAVLANIAADLLPEARELVGELAGFWVVVGFGLVFGLAELAGH